MTAVDHGQPMASAYSSPVPPELSWADALSTDWMEEPYTQEDLARTVLYYGLQQPQCEPLRQRQDDAYLAMQRKVGIREESARALIVSANLLSASVMSSQLAMYRWAVSEAQSTTQATTALLDEVNEAMRKGYSVRRTPSKPAGVSRYATGQGLQRLVEKKLARLERKRQRRAEREAAKAKAKAAGAAKEKKVRDGAGRPSAAAAGTARVPPFNVRADGAVRAAAASPASTTSGTPRPSEQLGGGGGIRGGVNANDVDGARSRSTSSSEVSSVCSAELHPPEDGEEDDGNGNHPYRKAGGPRDPLPPDAVTRLVVVDYFAHEPLRDVVEHLRYVDREYELGLVVVLLLPSPNDINQLQGAGRAVMPTQTATVEEAYSYGYDLVLTRSFDHAVVEMLTEVFVSSAGRWRNDLRAKAAVGNYVSLKNILLGRIDLNALTHMMLEEAGGDGTMDAELLQLIGAHTLALHGESKSYALASRLLSDQVSSVPGQAGTGGGGGSSIAEERHLNGTDVLVIADPDGADVSTVSEADRAAMGVNQRQGGPSVALPAGLARLRTHAPADAGNGVRSRQAEDIAPLAGFDMHGDVLNSLMQPASQVKHMARRRLPRVHTDANATDGDREGLASGGSGADGDECDYEYYLVDSGAENQAAVFSAIEAEMARLMAENDSKQASIELLQDDLERMHRTVAVLRRQQRFSSGEAGQPGSAAGEGGGGAVDTDLIGRPDSASLVNLSKEQQIYILKERLDAANDQIRVLAEQGNQRRQRAGNSSGQGTPPTSGAGPTSRGRGARVGRAPASQHSARATAEHEKDELSRRQALQSYCEHREAEAMTLYDVDAVEWPVLAVHWNHLSRPRGLDDMDEEALEAQRRARREERREADRLLQDLQAELDRMRQLQSQQQGPMMEGAERLAERLQSAMDLISSQRKRIQQMEEVRQLEEALAQRRGPQQGKHGAAAAVEQEESPRPKKKGRKQAESGARASPSLGGASQRKSGTTGGGAAESAAGAGDQTSSSGGGKPAPTEKQLVLLQKEMEQLREQHRDEMERQRATLTASFERSRQKELLRRERDVTAALTRLHLLSTRPYNEATRKALEEEARIAQKGVRGAWQRLQFALRKHAESLSRPDSGTSPLPPLAPAAAAASSSTTATGATALPATIEAIAKEHAVFSLRVLRAQEGMAEVVAATQTAEGQARRAKLLQRRAECMEAVQKATKDVLTDPSGYLRALVDLAAAEEDVAQWADLDLGVILTQNRTTKLTAGVPYGSRVITATATLQPPSSLASSQPPRVGSGSSRPPRPAPQSLALAVGGRPSDVVQLALSDRDGVLQAEVWVLDAAVGDDTQSSGNLRGSVGTPALGSPAATSSTSAVMVPPTSAKLADGAPLTVAPTSTAPLQPHTLASVAEMHLLTRNGEGSVDGPVDAQGHLCQLVMEAFNTGYIHPDRMAAIEQRATIAYASPFSAAEVGWDVLYLTHHQELQQLLALLVAHYPHLRPPIELLSTPAVVKSVTQTLQARSSSGGALRNGGDDGPVDVGLLMAVDTALLTWCVDVLNGVTAPQPPLQSSSPSTLPVSAQGALVSRSPTSLTPSVALPIGSASEGGSQEGTCTTAATTADGAETSPHSPRLTENGQLLRSPPPSVAYGARRDAAIAQQEKELARHRRSRRHRGGDGDADLVSSGTDEGDAFFITQTHLSQSGAPPLSSSGAALLHRVPGETEYSAEELASMFSRPRRGDGKKGGGLSPESLYLEEGDLGLGDAADDEEAQAMLAIRQELLYLSALKEQRQGELLHRLQLRREQLLARERQRVLDSLNAASGRQATTEADDNDVNEGGTTDVGAKAGSAAWYGMEAAKRVKDILRRRAKPDQVILGGGADGAGVGLEYSKRTAFPRRPPRDVKVVQTAQDRIRAAHRAAVSAGSLPPLHAYGQSRWQQQQTRRYYGAGRRGEEDGYVAPRDEVSVSAYGAVVGYHEMDGLDRLYQLAPPPDWEERLLAYRDTLRRAGSRLGTGTSPATAAPGRLGLPFCVALPGEGGALGVAAGGTSTRQFARTPPSRPGSSRAARALAPPQTEWTSWVYGVPQNTLHQLLHSSTAGIPTPSGEGDNGVAAAAATASSVLFLPQPTTASLEASSRPMAQRGVAAVEGRPQLPPGTLPPRPPSLHHNPYGRAAVGAGWTAAHSPAALAAQRLSAILYRSLADPTVASGGFPAPAADPATSPETQWRSPYSSPVPSRGAPLAPSPAGPAPPAKSSPPPPSARPLSATVNSNDAVGGSSGSVHNNNNHAEALGGTLPPPR